MPTKHIDHINKGTMHKSLEDYSCSDELTSAEHSALQHVTKNTELKDKPILDIGVGGGRTVSALRNISDNYLGLDYIKGMVDVCKRKFPEVDFEQGDARDLSKFPDHSFNLVMFSMNGISMVNHQGRLDILSEIHRVLAPGGHFLFSTYNQDNPDYKKLLHLPKFRPSLNPARLFVRSIKYISNASKRMLNRLRYKKLEFHSDEYSIVNDKCHNYATMLYYITQPNQREQLVTTGFHDEILAFDQSGDHLEGHTLEDSIFYVARKFR